MLSSFNQPEGELGLLYEIKRSVERERGMLFIYAIRRELGNYGASPRRRIMGGGSFYEASP